MEIFEQTMIYDDPRFESIDFDGAKSLLGNGTLDDDFNAGMGEKLSWIPNKLSSDWSPLHVIGGLRPFVDLTEVSLRHPVYSQRAVAVLEDLLLQGGELLPIRTVAGLYYVLNIQHVSDAIDRASSKIAFPSPGSRKETAFGIDYHVFVQSKLSGHSIFRVRECPQRVYVTDTYKARVEAASLNGFCFNKVWPLNEGDNWRELAAKESQRRSKEVARLNGQSLSILLSTETSQPTQVEIDLGYLLAEQVSTNLAANQRSIDENYIGGVESTETGKKCLQIHLGGPDSQKIFEIIEPWLNNIAWPNRVEVLMWKGNRNDKKTEKVKSRIK